MMWSANLLAFQNETTPEQTSTQLELRQFDEGKLSDYRSDEDYNYQVYKEVEKGAFQRLLDRIYGWFLRLFNNGTTGKIIEYGIYLLLFAAFVFFIIKLFGIEVNSIFKANRKSSQSFEVTEESLDQINFEEEILKAEQNKQWRLAIRLIYLRTLKSLADRGTIQVKKGKTNHDYLYEIEGEQKKEQFSSLSFIFDYTWYGHFDASEALLAQVKEYYSALENLERAA